MSGLRRWISAHDALEGLVDVLEINEVGVDFVSRPYVIYHYALREYDEPDKSDLAGHVPEELGMMRDRVRRLEASLAEGEQEILWEVAAASLLGSSPSTMFDGQAFIVVSPVISLARLSRWAELRR
ncbi:MAG: hypothetical protein AAF467_09890 [Actinomycetota bacterium]